MWFSKGTAKHLIVIVFLFSVQAWAKVTKEFFLREDLSYLKQTDVDREGRPWRLPNTTYPLKYQLHITTWIHQEIYNFTGNVTIELLVKENTSELVLHARHLKIQRIFAKDLKTMQNIENLKSRIIDDLLIIEAIGIKPHVFAQNQRLRLEIHYTGVINDLGKGFSTMTYQDDKNNTIYGAYTQMEAIYAREVLPCYDEPALKANFTIRITHGSNCTAISNMPAISTLENGSDKMITTSFLETPLMSTYLLAFVISNYKFIAREGNGIIQRAFFPPNFKNTGNLALTNGIQVLQIFAKYTDVPYVMPKLDHISIKEFSSAAMENWGLITYTEKYFIKDNSSDLIISYIEIVTENHEIVHQWFGNLVSPEWWNSLWLNEGFANYYSYVLMKKLYPEYRPVENFMVTCHNNEIYDTFISVADYVEEPEDIEKKFAIANAYTKAPCILQMFEHAFEEPVFRKGASNFLKARAFSTANENHLYGHLQAALLESSQSSWNYSVHEIMRPWLHAKTLPIVIVTRDYNNSHIIHIQQKSAMTNVKELWWIPLNFATASQPNFESTKTVYYMPPISAVTLNLTEFNITLHADDWIIANIQSTGFYRVAYDNENLLRLAKVFNTNYSIVHKLNRALILSSIPSIWVEQLSAISSLEILKYIPYENDPIVWLGIMKMMQSLQKLLCPSVSCELYNDFVRNILKSQYLKYINTPEKELSYTTAAMRRELIKLACDLDVPECIKQSSSQDRYGCDAVKTYNDTEFDDALKILKKIDCERFRFNLRSLLCTQKKIQFEQVLAAAADYLEENVMISMFNREMLSRLWAYLLHQKVKEWKSISTYSFLKKQIPEFFRLPEAGYKLCINIASVAKEIKKPFYEKYIELMELCTKQLLMSGTIKNSSEIMPIISDIGVNYAFENSPIWRLELQKINRWFKEQNSY